MYWGELAIALVFIIGGAVLHWKSRRMGATDMQVLGAMLWIAGLILAPDSKLHFFTGPSNHLEP